MLKAHISVETVFTEGMLQRVFGQWMSQLLQHTLHTKASPILLGDDTFLRVEGVQSHRSN